MPIDLFDLKVLGRPLEHLYTKEGALKLLPRLLSDLYHQCEADEEDFLDLLVQCLPIPTVVAITHADYLDTDDSGRPSWELRRFIYENNLDSLEIPFKEFKQANIEDIRVPIKSEDMTLGETKSIIRAGYRVTFPYSQEIPTDKELLEILKLWKNNSDATQGEIVIKKKKEYSLEGEEIELVEEKHKYLIEEVGEKD